MTPTFQDIQHAVAFAARAHDGQYRKDGATPYLSHVLRVTLIVRDLFGFDDPRMLITAILHDTIEDTTTDFDDIEKRFGKEIATWVSFLTKDKRLPDDERERAYLDRLLQAPWQVQVCKLADIFDNLSDIANLPSERRAHSLQRAEQYFAELRYIQAPEAKQPMAIVERLLADLRGASVAMALND